MEFVFTMFGRFTLSKPYQHNGFNAIKKCNSIYSCLSANCYAIIYSSYQSRLRCILSLNIGFQLYNLYRSGHALVLVRLRWRQEAGGECCRARAAAMCHLPSLPSGTHNTDCYYCFVFRCRSIKTHTNILRILVVTVLN